MTACGAGLSVLDSRRRFVVSGELGVDYIFGDGVVD